MTGNSRKYYINIYCAKKYTIMKLRFLLEVKNVYVMWEIYVCSKFWVLIVIIVKKAMH